jgi:hypothetical protein
VGTGRWWNEGENIYYVWYKEINNLVYGLINEEIKIFERKNEIQSR